MFENIPTSTLCVFYAFLDVYSPRYYNFDDMKKALFHELLQRSSKKKKE